MEHSELQELFWKACERGDSTAISWFVKLGADVTADDNVAIRWAAENGHTETVRLLAQLGADVTATARDNYAIVCAAANGHMETVKLLAQLGSDVTVIDNYTIRRAMNYHTEIVKLIAKMRVNSRYALGFSRVYGYINATKVLEEVLNEQTKTIEHKEKQIPGVSQKIRSLLQQKNPFKGIVQRIILWCRNR